MNQHVTWYGAIGLGPGYFVLDGDPTSPSQKGAEAPINSAHVYCGQTAARIKMPLGTEVGLGLRLRDIVFDVDPATPRKRAHPPHPPNFWPMSIVANNHQAYLIAY